MIPGIDTPESVCTETTFHFLFSGFLDPAKHSDRVGEVRPVWSLRPWDNLQATLKTIILFFVSVQTLEFNHYFYVCNLVFLMAISWNSFKHSKLSSYYNSNPHRFMQSFSVFQELFNPKTRLFMIDKDK
jgi:hypothetical protein